MEDEEKNEGMEYQIFVQAPAENLNSDDERELQRLEQEVLEMEAEQEKQRSRKKGSKGRRRSRSRSADRRKLRSSEKKQRYQAEQNAQRYPDEHLSLEREREAELKKIIDPRKRLSGSGSLPPLSSTALPAISAHPNMRDLKPLSRAGTPPDLFKQDLWMHQGR
uniref:Uncharacterized protein n=1 Tax=Eutreptiella gymnastica TaxID=73025 RepID=A0A7S1NSI7_9EUGL